jgi:hypothetical protein
VFWRWLIALPFPSLAPFLLFLFFYPCSWTVSTLVLVLVSFFFLSFFCFWNCEIRANLLRVCVVVVHCRGSAAAMEIPERNKSKLRGPKTYEEEPRRDPSLQINSKVRDWDRTLRQLLFPVNFFVSFQGKMCRHWGFCLYSQRILALQLPVDCTCIQVKLRECLLLCLDCILLEKTTVHDDYVEFFSVEFLHCFGLRKQTKIMQP